MLTHWVMMALLMLPVQVAGQAGANDEGLQVQAPVVVLQSVPGGDSPVRVVLGGDVKVVLADDNQDPAPVWLGVRLTTVPAPLGAHIGGSGAMIANVVKGSPADKAGLQQYDVVTLLNGHEVKAPGDLTKAVEAAKVGQAIKLTVVRKANPQTVDVTPIERPKDMAWEMKYPEPEAAFADSAINTRGRMIMRGPNGSWTVRDLGELPELPGDVGKLLGPEFKDKMEHLGDALKDMDIRILRKLPSGEEGAQIQIMIKTKDGKTTKVERDADGKIHVTHTDKDGKETSAVYDNAEALEKGDAEAYGLFEEHSAGGNIIHLRPFGDEARKLRGEFQLNIEKKVRDALDRAKQAQEKAEREVRKHMDTAPETPKHEPAPAENAPQHVQPRKPAAEAPVAAPPKAPHAADKGWSVRVADDGKIRLTIKRAGERKAYEFSNKEEFKAAEPEIYEQVKGLFE